MPSEAVETARKRLTLAAEDLNADRVAALVADLTVEWGVAGPWEQVCVPALTALRGHTAAEIAVEHALSEGVRVGLDVFRRDRPTAAHGVLLAGAEHETHSLGLHALSAALRERSVGSLLLGPALPWAALADATYRTRPRTVVVWSQTPVTGRAYRLVRFARDFPSLRVHGAGPGWIEPLTRPVSHLASLPAAVAACLPPAERG
ncbi:transcriptional regulator [Micromonospora terminaliae]|uniref:Transcriptional regulator n=2 Tax=Micromonospora terminaliae TaxID=1914461 RepID=A0AAJ3DL93_9ACTN|nr:transcriptional regulator [Micromonospora terminaliae]NES27920.1 transcriptional regulator [Micromonospora terminaliae]QGL51314.1 transcriptional regulator [Micromonospora terminaliae]